MLTKAETDLIKVKSVTGPFLSEISNRSLYAYTFTPHESYVRNKGIWWTLSAREDYVLDLFDLFDFSINRLFANHWKRLATRPAVFFGAVEHHKKKDRSLAVPHIHGLLAIEPAWVSVLVGHLGTGNLLDLDCLKGSGWNYLGRQIDSVRIEPLNTPEDLNTWSNYSFEPYLPKDIPGLWLDRGLRFDKAESYSTTTFNTVHSRTFNTTTRGTLNANHQHQRAS